MSDINKLQKLNILHLEDAPLDAELVFEYLRSNLDYSIELDLVSNESDFIRALTSRQYNLILSDFSLPSFDGFAAIKHVKLICPMTPIIFVSGFIGEEPAVELLKQGAADFISKERLGKLSFAIERTIKEIEDKENYKQLQLTIIDNEERYRSTFEQAPVGIFYLSIDGSFIKVNRKLAQILGYQTEQLLKMSIQDITLAEYINYDLSQIKKLYQNEIETYTSETRYRRADQSLVWVNIVFSLINLSHIGEEIILGLVEDINERKLNEITLKVRNEEIAYLVYHDQLTGLYNRRYFGTTLDKLDVETNLPISIILGDINGLKLINDSFGNQVGDRLLIDIANMLKSIKTDDDVLARFDGDEFIMILPKTDRLKASKIVKRIKTMTDMLKIGSLNVSVSFCFESKEKSDDKISDALRRVQANMNRIKLNINDSFRSNTVKLILETLFAKNNRELLHSRRVSELCAQIGIKLGLNEDSINQLRTTGLMHDIGKIGIDENILNKTSRLNDDERVEIKKHSEIGYRILSSVSDFSEIAEDVLQHHERYDGTGYPYGLSGQQISLNARIVGIADSYDAMVSARPYRPLGQVFNEDEVLAELIRCAGSQFDPNITRLFIEEVLQKTWKQTDKAS